MRYRKPHIQRPGQTLERADEGQTLARVQGHPTGRPD